MLKFFKKLFEQLNFDQKEYAIRYLSESYDHVDLERRMKELEQRGIRWY
jgi:hypothetical protein